MLGLLGFFHGAIKVEAESKQPIIADTRPGTMDHARTPTAFPSVIIEQYHP